MGLIQRYLDYIRDNPERYWFKRKLYGWGWTPATWEGWLTIIFFIGLLFWNALRLDAGSHSVSDTVRPFIIQAVLIVAVLIAICYWKGEKPKWMWGLPKEKENE